MGLILLFSTIILLLIYLCDREVLRFDSDTFLHYVRLFAVGSAIAIAVRYVLGLFPPKPEISFGTLLLVPWEDVLFSLVLIYYPRKFLNPKLALFTTIISSVAFGIGHLYQGPLFGLIACFYPFFISYKLGTKYGYGTVFALHVVYDVTVCSTVLFLNYVR